MRIFQRIPVLASLCLLTSPCLVAGLSQLVIAQDGLPLSGKQQGVAERFKKLEGLLLRSSELESIENPTRAALLQQAAKLGKQKQLADLLAKASNNLKNEKFTEAIEQQKAGLTNLKELLELLQSENREKRVREERDQVKQWIEETDRLLRMQGSLRGRTEGGQDTEKAAQDQQRLASKAGEIAGDLSGDPSGQQSGEESEGGEKPGSNEPKDGADANPEDGEDPKSGENSEAKESPGGSESEGENSSSGGDSENQSPDGQEDSKGSETNEPGDADSREPGESTDDTGNSEKSNQDPEDSQEMNPKGSEAERQTIDNSSDQEPGKPSSNGQDSKPNNQPGQQSQNGQESQGQDGQQSQQDQQSQDGQQSQQQQQQPKTPAERAQQRIQQAQQKMREAQEALEQAKRDEAVEQQLAAEEMLREAIEELEEILRQLREEEIERSLASLEDRLRRMLDMQTDVLSETTRLMDISGGATGNRQVAIKASQLAEEEKKILAEGERAYLLLREEGSSSAFPEAMEQMNTDIAFVQGRLGEGIVDELTKDIEESIVSSLEEMVQALVEVQKENEKKKQQRQQQQQPGQQMQPGDQPLVDKLAELRLIKTLQKRINIEALLEDRHTILTTIGRDAFLAHPGQEGVFVAEEPDADGLALEILGAGDAGVLPAGQHQPARLEGLRDVDHR